MKKLLLCCLLFSCLQLEIKAQEVSMKTKLFSYHYYQGDKNISKNELTNLLKTDIVAQKHWKRSISFNTLSWIALASEAGFATWNIIDKNPKNDTAANIGIYGSFAAVIAFNLISHAQKKKAIARYNEGIRKSNAFTIEPSSTGFGIVMRF